MPAPRASGSTPTKWMYAMFGSVCETNPHTNPTMPCVPASIAIAVVGEKCSKNSRGSSADIFRPPHQWSRRGITYS